MADFSRLLERLREIGEEVVRPAATDVDARARFPSEAFAALRGCGALGAYVPEELGGSGLSVRQLARICELLGRYDGSVAMIYAMHSIQVGCLVHHGLGSPFFRDYLAGLAAEQRLIASATSEVGTGGDLRSSICAIETSADRFTVTKRAPVISYGSEADDILLTCRCSAAAPAADQVAVLLKKGDYRLERVSGWDTLGFRGTCSSGFVVSAAGRAEQVVPAPFAEVLARTMHPVSHILWSSLWLGIAADAVERARQFVLAQARRNPAAPAVSSLRLAETDTVLHTLRSTIGRAVDEHETRVAAGPQAPDGFGFAIRINNLKLASSTLVVDVVSRALLVCGIEGYRNDSRYSLCRHLRDAYGAALMVNNDRIAGHNATMLLGQREEGRDA